MTEKQRRLIAALRRSSPTYQRFFACKGHDEQVSALVLAVMDAWLYMGRGESAGLVVDERDVANALVNQGVTAGADPLALAQLGLQMTMELSQSV